MRKRLFNLTLALGLIVGLCAAAIGSASAETPVGSQVDWIFYPWVPNGETMGGTGPWFGSITIQNLENFRVNIAFGQTAGGVTPSSTTTLEAHASKTFSATDLGLPGTGAGVAVRATWYFDPNTGAGPSAICGTSQTTTSETITRGSTGLTDPVATGNAIGIDGDIVDANGTTYTQGTDFIYQNGTIAWQPGHARPAAGVKYTVTFFVADCTRGPVIGGVEKQVTPGDKAFTTNSSSANLIVDGYTAIPDSDVAWGPASAFCHDVHLNLFAPTADCNNLGSYYLGLPVGLFTNGTIGFDGHSYLPIVQGDWNGWDTVIHLTNIDSSSPSFAAVEVHFYAAGQGVNNQAGYIFQTTVNQGQTTTIDAASVLKGMGIDHFVGSAWITSDYGVVATSNRVKATTSMAITNTSAPSLFATTSVDNAFYITGGIPPTLLSAFPNPLNGSTSLYEMYAPLVYRDYNGWNTGINIANISEITNQVTVQFYGRDGTSAGSYTTSIPPKGMQYVYIPNTQDQGLGNGDFGSAVISGQLPFHAAVDEVKYSTGEAMSYLATASAVQPCGAPSTLTGPGCENIMGDTLSLSLFQKGNGSSGDTSGINLFNPSSASINGTVNFYLPSGAQETPSTISSVPFTLGPDGSGLIYAPNMAQMTPGASVTAVIQATGGLGSLTAVSNQVNYDVQGDGSLSFNMFNHNGQFRYVCGQASCGVAVVTPDGSIFIIPPYKFAGPVVP